jgi:hypothetical protein
MHYKLFLMLMSSFDVHWFFPYIFNVYFIICDRKGNYARFMKSSDLLQFFKIGY